MQQEVEQDTDEYLLEDERIDELIELEVQMQEQGVEPDKTPLLSMLQSSRILSYPYSNPTTGTVTNIERVDTKTVKIEYEVKGNTNTSRLTIDSKKLANLLTYVGIKDGRIMDLQGKKVPVAKSRYRGHNLNIPTNVSLGGTFMFKLMQSVIRLGLVSYDNRGDTTVRVGTITIPLLLGFPIFMSAMEFLGEPSSGLGMLLTLTIGSLLLIGMACGVVIMGIHFLKVYSNTIVPAWRSFSPFQ